MQKSFIVYGYFSDDEWYDNTDSLNEYLSSGYKVVSQAPMGAYAHGEDETDHGFASLVILEKKVL